MILFQFIIILIRLNYILDINDRDNLLIKHRVLQEKPHP